MANNNKFTKWFKRLAKKVRRAVTAPFHQRKPVKIEITDLKREQFGNLSAIYGISKRGQKPVYITHFTHAASPHNVTIRDITSDKRLARTPQRITAITISKDGETVISALCNQKSRRFVTELDAELVELFLSEAGVENIPTIVKSKRSIDSLLNKPVPPAPPQPRPGMYSTS